MIFSWNPSSLPKRDSFLYPELRENLLRIMSIEEIEAKMSEK
jgi:hypothetical protein